MEGPMLGGLGLLLGEYMRLQMLIGRSLSINIDGAEPNGRFPFGRDKIGITFANVLNIGPHELSGIQYRTDEYASPDLRVGDKIVLVMADASKIPLKITGLSFGTAVGLSFGTVGSADKSDIAAIADQMDDDEDEFGYPSVPWGDGRKPIDETQLWVQAN